MVTSGGKVPAAEGRIMSDWFQVVDRGVIVFEGPLESCGDYVRSLGDYGYDLIIRPISF